MPGLLGCRGQWSNGVCWPVFLRWSRCVPRLVRRIYGAIMKMFAPVRSEFEVGLSSGRELDLVVRGFVEGGAIVA